MTEGRAHDVLDVRKLSVAQWQDELWFGFWDYTDCFGMPMHCPYRILRVKDGCVYQTLYELNNPE